MVGTEIYERGFRLNPTPLEAVTYYLRRLITSEPLHEVVWPVIHRADIYAFDPAELARRFRPMPNTAGDHRWFFTTWKKGVRAAGPGSWVVQQGTKHIRDKEGPGGVKVGVLRKLKYERPTSWLMDEFSACGLPGAVVGDREYVFCKVYVSPRAEADDPAWRESAAFFALPPPPAVITPPAAPPPPPQFAISPCHQRMRPTGGSTFLAPPQPPAPLATVHQMSLAPPQLRRSSPPAPLATQPSRTPVQALAPQVPTRPAVKPSCSPMAAPPRPAVIPPPAAPPVPPQFAISPCPNRMLQAGGNTFLAPRQPPAPPAAPTPAPLPAVQKMYFAPPQPPAARRGSATPLATQPSPASALPPASQVPTCPAVKVRRSPMPAQVAAAAAAAPKRPSPPQAAMLPCPKRLGDARALPVVQPAGGNNPPQPLAPIATSRKLPFAPPQPSELRRSSPPAPLLTKPSPASALPPASQVPTCPAVQVRRSPMPAQMAAAKRPAPPRAAMSPCPKRMRGAIALPVLQPAGGRPPQPPAPLAAVRKTPFAPPQPSELRRSSPPAPLLTQPSPTPVQAPTPPVPTRPAVKPGCLPMPALPRRPAQPKKHQQQQVALPTPPMVKAYRQAVAPPWPCQPKQRIIGNPFEEEAEQQTVGTAPDLLPPPSKEPPAAAVQDEDEHDWDEDALNEINKALDLDDDVPTVEASPATHAAALQEDFECDDDWDELENALGL